MCVCKCVCSCTHVRGVFPPPSCYVHVGKFDLPDYSGHALTHTLSFFSDASPALATLRIHTHTQESTHSQTHIVKVQGFAKLQQTSFLLRSHSSLSVTAATETGQSWLFQWLQSCWQEAVGSLDSPYFLFLLMPASVRVCVCVCALFTKTSGI